MARAHVFFLLTLTFLLVSPVRAQGSVTGNVPYLPDGDAFRRLDVYLPSTAAPYPTLLLIHGGGFVSGDKAQLGGYAGAFAARGYAVVSINYRLAPDNLYPAALQDAFCALGWVEANAAAYGFDPQRIAAIGESAGGYLATQLATVDQPATYLADCPYGVPANALRGVVDYYPLTGASFDSYSLPALLAMSTFIGVPGGQFDVLRARWPGIADIDGNEPPFLLIHGTGDDVVPAHDSVDLYDRLQAVGARADLVLMPDVDHGFISLLDQPEAQQAIQSVAAFLNSIGMSAQGA